jgi:hypothetical protein
VRASLLPPAPWSIHLACASSVVLSGLAVLGQVLLNPIAQSEGRGWAYGIGLALTALIAVIAVLTSALALRMGMRLSAPVLSVVSVGVAIFVPETNSWIAISAASVALVVIIASWLPSSRRFRQARAAQTAARIPSAVTDEGEPLVE